jgi:predicted PurR-regulated permease PerM
MRRRLFRRPSWAARDAERGYDPTHPADGGAASERERPPAPPLPPPQLPVAPALVPRWIQAVVLPLALLGLWELARAAGSVLVILVFASVIALILNPIAKRLERVMPRGLSIAAVYIAMIAAVTVVVILVSNLISTQVDHFSGDVPHLVKQANQELDNFQRFLNRNGITIHIKQQGQSALNTLERDVAKNSGSIVSFSRDLLSKLVTLSVDVVLTLVLSVYLLVYAREIGDLARRILPPGTGEPDDDYPLLVQGAVSGYVRGQLLFSLIMGTSAAIALWLFGVIGIFPNGSKYAVFFGAFYGIAELVPYVGPIVGPIPAVLVALFTNPISALWVVLLFIGLQQLEGHVVAPQVFRISLRINPIIVILSLLVGYQIYGIAGALMALPIATVTRQTIIYLRRHLVLEPWGRAVPAQAPGHQANPPPIPDPPTLQDSPASPEPREQPPAPLEFEGDEVAAYREDR